MRIAEWSLHFCRLAYSRPVKWFNSIEDGAVLALLRVVADDGAVGVAEAPLRPTWSGVSPRSLAAVLEDLLLPAVQEIDAGDAAAVSRQLARFPESFLAKMLIDNACWTLRAAAAGKPLWQLLGGQASVEVSWCVTRQPPEAMAREAAEIVAAHGFRALKIKGGQGIETDVAALRQIRAAVGDAIDFYVDANSAYPRAEAADYVRVIAAEGARVAEDPCPLQPDRQFAELIGNSAIPVLVDSSCASLKDAAQYLERGAKALSVKPGRIGISEARRIADLAREKGANVCSGMYAESALGTLISLQFSGALTAPLVPAEQSFYLMMRDQLLREPLEVSGGRVHLPAASDTVQLVDWDKVERYGIKP
ncbi:MAG: mandelate racemase/muconate lactonizing enzyme family protein [Hyphomicrobiaceae bacterium]